MAAFNFHFSLKKAIWGGVFRLLPDGFEASLFSILHPRCKVEIESSTKPSEFIKDKNQY